ncbi:PEGA domain-containing protein [Pleurocapsales cyanobacterium LEGE 10410]|nr:PEGA domain-containing protein [Pleurocapsales cyanobacterium LEGE 10410]
MKIITSILTVTLFLLFTQACGTIIHGTTQEVGISSSPSNASVTINGQNHGNTPMIIDLKRKDSHMVKIELDGYQPYETNLTRSTSGWVWGNIVFGGLIGLVVDASAGGMYKLSPEQLNAELRSSQAEALSSNAGLFIAVVLEADPTWERIGSLETSK